MSIYVPPALNAVDFALESFTPADLTPAEQALTAYTVPALNAVDFALTAYTQPTYPDVGWELLPGAGSVTGTLAWTEDNDVCAVAGEVSQSATLAWTEADDVSAIAGTVSQSATLAWTEEDDVTAIAAAVSQAATLAWTEEDDVTSITADVSGGTSPVVTSGGGGGGLRYGGKRPKYWWEVDPEAIPESVILSDEIEEIQLEEQAVARKIDELVLERAAASTIRIMTAYAELLNEQLAAKMALVQGYEKAQEMAFEEAQIAIKVAKQKKKTMLLLN